MMASWRVPIVMQAVKMLRGRVSCLFALGNNVELGSRADHCVTFLALERNPNHDHEISRRSVAGKLEIRGALQKIESGQSVES